ncbi:pLS20_p028 family conjugation system transmembrane protein, partial [Turicibacter bilis]|uniref:pLS20_p028 family conjugation system transmembrane protein n=1 Tax=Turicibacter bilis TaxID=2735723 RepID=UPI001BAEF1E0
MRNLILNRLKLKQIGIISIPIFLFSMQQLLVSASGFYPSQIVAYVEKSSLFSDVFRSVIWSIVYFFSTICTFFENGMWKILSFTNNFFQVDGLVKLMNKTDKIYLVFLVPVVAFVGYQILIREKLDPLKQFCRNFLFLMIVTLSISTLLNIGNSVLMGAVGAINQQSKISVGEQVILDNLYDIEYLKKNPNSSVKNYYALKGNVNLDYFDLTTKADRDVFKKYPIYDESTGSWKELDLSDGMILTGFGKEYVYRYTLDNPFIIIIQLVTLTFGFVFSSLKFAVLILELGFKRVILLGVGILDLSSGTKFKRLLVEIGNTLILMFIVVILVQCYVIANGWITKVSSDDIYVELILRIASVLMLLNGPRIVETLFGLDAGISKDGLQAVHYATSLGRTASSIGQSIGRTGSKAKSLATGFGKRMKETTNKVLDTRGTESSTSAQHQVANRLDRPNEVLKGHEKAKEQGIKNQRSERLDKPNQSLQGSMMVGEQGTANEVAERLDKPNQSLQGSMMVGEQGTANEVAERLDKPNQSLQGSMMVGEQGTANEVAERLDKPNQSLQGSMMVGEQGRDNEVAKRLDKPNQSLQGSMMVGEQGTANEVAERLDKPNQSLQGSMMVG